ncbi:hypothetical protein B5K05_01300 [Rhizobium phaseoli]|uniref:helix-turn-helix domain-containing protein n=1 Tax=Rhizobium phaseoli TaxID=396 RepID=UPI000E2D4CB6|nr:helix-turn-helix domain-containing protein [Rhizobium phaseoli]RDJ18355.1 hypothetical protein B5K04_01295 [Rhizobium phaseoli]RDJ19447.1 hypothetical protein B5K05_01300 [Rhizobium phaseoli]
MTLLNRKNRLLNSSKLPRSRVRLEEAGQAPIQKAKNSRRRVRIAEPAGLERLPIYRPLPLGWKNRKDGPKGLLFKHMIKDSPHLFYLKTAEAAEFLGVSLKTLRKWRIRGEGPIFTKIGTTFRYNVASLLECAAERRNGSTSQE